MANSLNHDLAHAANAEELMHPRRFYENVANKQRAAREFFQTFRYERETRGLRPREHLLFDIGYTLYFRETLADPHWIYRYAALAVQDPATRAEVIDLYRGNTNLHLRIEGDDVRVILAKRSYFVDRFQNPGDLYVNLPREVKAALRTHPKPHRLVRTFLEEALSTFFTAHYRHASRQLGVNSALTR